MLSNAPVSSSISSDSQNKCEIPKTIVAAPKPATAQSNVLPMLRDGGRWVNASAVIERADGRCGTHPPQSRRADIQNVFRVNRQQGRRSAEQDGEQIERDRGEDDFRLPNETEPRDQRAQRDLLGGAVCLFSGDHRDERGEEKTQQRIGDVHQGGAMQRGDHQTAQCRADDGRHLVSAGPPRHGVAEKLQRHGLRKQRSSGGPVERQRGGAQQQAAVHQRHRTLKVGQRGETERGEHHHQLGDDDDPLAVEPVRHVPGRHRQKNDRQRLHQPDPAQRHGRAGPLVQFPADGHRLHEAARVGEHAAGKQQAAVAEPQPGIRVMPRSARRRLLPLFGGGFGVVGLHPAEPHSSMKSRCSQPVCWSVIGQLQFVAAVYDRRRT